MDKLLAIDTAFAASLVSGSQAATANFALAAGNTNPQGIADPPPPTVTDFVSGNN